MAWASRDGEPERAAGSERPALQLRNGFLERAAFFVPARYCPEAFVRLHCQVEREGIVLCASKTGGVVGKRGPCELVGGKLASDLLPTLGSRTGVGFAECPEMPSASVVRITGNSSCGQGTNDVGATTGQPIGIGEDDHGLGIGWPRGNHALIDRNDHFREVTKRRRGCNQRVGVCCVGKRLHAVE